MARRPKRSRGRGREFHWLTWTALACVIVFGATVIATNAVGWPRLIPGPLGVVAAILAICAGGFAFSLWEHVRLFARARRWPNLAGALLLFIGALAIDAIGVHSGIETLAEPWRTQMESEAEGSRQRAQDALDERRNDLQAEIDRLQDRIDAVPLVLPGRPQSDEQARLAWNEQTADDRRRLAQKRAQLDGMLRTVPPEPVAPWLSPATWAFALFAELVVAFGVSILGIEIAPQFAAREEGRGEIAPTPPPPVAAVVTPITAARASRRVSADASRWSGWDD